jgi:hypothetical protein
VTGGAISAFSQSFSQRKIIAMSQRGLPWTARSFSQAVNQTIKLAKFSRRMRMVSF